MHVNLLTNPKAKFKFFKKIYESYEIKSKTSFN